MVSQFPQDYMHLVLLGIMRKLLNTWCSGQPRRRRLSALNITRISDRLVRFRPCMPVEFQRKPRTLLDIRHYKATELRTVLCYTGPIAFRDILEDDVYDNFMLLSCAMRILLSTQLNTMYGAFAGQLLRAFVEHVKVLYGEQMLTYNMHGLIHIADQAAARDTLDDISSFPFENHLFQLKRMLRKNQKTLKQLVHRILERRAFPAAAKPRDVPPVFLRPSNTDPPPFEYRDCLPYNCVICQTVRFDNTPANSCIEINGRFGVISSILKRGRHQPFAVVQYFADDNNLFEYPAPSRSFGVRHVGPLSLPKHVVPVYAMNKCILLPMDDGKSACISMMSGM